MVFTKHHLDRARHFYDAPRGKTIVLARFLHFIRTLAPMIAGAADMHYGTFLCITLSAVCSGPSACPPSAIGWATPFRTLTIIFCRYSVSLACWRCPRPSCVCSTAACSNDTRANSHSPLWGSPCFWVRSPQRRSQPLFPRSLI